MNKPPDLEPSEVVEQLENELMDLAVVKWMAGDSEPSSKQKQVWLEHLQESQGKDFYSNLLFTLTGHRYSDYEAPRLWDDILIHRDSLTDALGRNPGIVVACLDFLTNKLKRDIEFRLIENQKLENVLERAVADSLTGLYDHDTLFSLLDNELARSIRHNHPLSFILMDLDDFKQVNDTYGHQKGDDVLIRLSRILEKTIRVIDTAGRYGGEEFAVILPETAKAAAIQTADRIRMAVQSAFLDDLQITISMGISAWPDDGSTTESLVKHADESLYKAKENGKNCIVA
jgi:diguanylate cyclase (GGDEF)-like protein